MLSVQRGCARVAPSGLYEFNTPINRSLNLFSIIPREAGFYKLFEESSDTVIATAQAYANMLKTGLNDDEQMEKIRDLEHANDDVVRRTLEKLDRTFLTPFDREDIHRLMKRLDDVVDDIDATTKRLRLYKITEATPWIIKQSELLANQCVWLGAAIRKLRHAKKESHAMRELLVKVHRAETEGDENHHAAVAELYESSGNPINAIKWKELYDLTERAIDRCEDVADVMEGMLFKNT